MNDTELPELRPTQEEVIARGAAVQTHMLVKQIETMRGEHQSERMSFRRTLHAAEEQHKDTVKNLGHAIARVRELEGEAEGHEIIARNAMEKSSRMIVGLEKIYADIEARVAELDGDENRDNDCAQAVSLALAKVLAALKADVYTPPVAVEDIPF